MVEPSLPYAAEGSLADIQRAVGAEIGRRQLAASVALLEPAWRLVDGLWERTERASDEDRRIRSLSTGEIVEEMNKLANALEEI